MNPIRDQIQEFLLPYGIIVSGEMRQELEDFAASPNFIENALLELAEIQTRPLHAEMVEHEVSGWESSDDNKVSFYFSGLTTQDIIKLCKFLKLLPEDNKKEFTVSKTFLEANFIPQLLEYTKQTLENNPSKLLPYFCENFAVLNYCMSSWQLQKIVQDPNDFTLKLLMQKFGVELIPLIEKMEGTVAELNMALYKNFPTIKPLISEVLKYCEDHLGNDSNNMESINKMRCLSILITAKVQQLFGNECMNVTQMKRSLSTSKLYDFAVLFKQAEDAFDGQEQNVPLRHSR